MLDWSLVDPQLLFEGTLTTLGLVTLALVIGLILALPMALVLEFGPAPLRWPIGVFGYVFRGTPLLVQLYLVYYGSAQFEWVRDSVLWPMLREAWWCALITFTLNTAAYTMVILQGAIRTADRGELEAGRACGMSTPLLWRRILLPGVVRRALPSYGNEVIFMLHGSAVAGVVTVMDITGVARKLYAQSYSPYEPFLAAALLYLALTMLITASFLLLERRLRIDTSVRPSQT